MENKVIIIGLGASAGGLEALKDLISCIKPSGKFCYVVAQHLSPSHKSMLVTLLAKNSDIEVKELSDGDKIVADTIYITPPNYNVRCSDDRFLLAKPENFVGPKPSIDILFKSMAEHHEQLCCGIILSGTGSDGSVGVRAIKAAGGITIAQEPKKAKYDGMPRSAIDTGDVDIVMSAQKIYSELEDIFINNRPIHIEEVTDHLPGNYKKIVDILRKSHKIDLDGYKENTIDRRIRRRMAALRIDSYSSYVRHIQSNQKEVDNLFKDLLISVTSFFRDGDAYRRLQEILTEKHSDSGVESFRVWVAACATGEEAYSIAILLNELFENRHGNVDIQIFATDIDEDALAIARKGVYPEASLSDLPQHLVEKYFRRFGSNFEVTKSLREYVIFSRHDISKDPPFLRIDLISCRNLMIYFKPVLQKEVLSKFYYSLNPKGLLFLGKSETVGDLSPIIKAVDSKLRIYEISETDSKFRRMHMSKYNYTKKREEIDNATNKFNINNYLSDLTLYEMFDRFIVIDDNYTLYYVHGHINEFMDLSVGAFKSNVMNMLNKAVRAELRGLVQMARESDKIVTGSYKLFKTVHDTFYYRLQIKKIKHEDKETGFMIIMLDQLDKDHLPFSICVDNDFKDDRYSQLESELNGTKEHLQTVIEELETSNEELQSLNEELQSSNEELQSSNEELETTNEELQATNEELNTAYVELKQVYEEKDRDQKLLAEKSEALETYKNELLHLNSSLERRVVDEVRQRVEKEIFISKIFNTANVGICLTNSKGEFHEFNEAYRAIYGYEREEMIGKHFSIVVSEEFKAIAKKMHDDFILGIVEEIPTEWEVVRKDGRRIIIVTTASRVKLDKEVFKITSVTDITDIKLLEEEKRIQEHLLIQQSKFAAMGEMIGAIAHQWRQPIHTLGLIFQSSIMKLNDEKLDSVEIREQSETGLQVIDFMNETIKLFKDFYSVTSTTGSINAVEQTVATLRILSAKIQTNSIIVDFKVKREKEDFTSIGYESEDIKYHKFITDFSISGVANDFQQILLAVISNAIDAIEERVLIEKSITKKVTVNILSGDSDINVDIYDNGTGIPDNLKDKIFEPYFTTKDKEKGAGIGLYIVKQIVSSRFGGEIKCGNTRHGAKISIKLPRF